MGGCKSGLINIISENDTFGFDSVTKLKSTFEIWINDA